MKTNSKQVRELVKTHILECVYNYEEANFATIKEAANHLYNEFDRVANHPYNLKRIPIDQDRFSDYLCGLPFHFHYYSGDVMEFLNSLGINPENKVYAEDKSLKLYHYLIYSETIKNK